VEHDEGIEPEISDSRAPGYPDSRAHPLHTGLVGSPPMEEAACDHYRISMRKPDTARAAARVERHESPAFEPAVITSSGAAAYESPARDAPARADTPASRC
jgi:hypothetical protein